MIRSLLALAFVLYVDNIHAKNINIEALTNRYSSSVIKIHVESIIPNECDSPHYMSHYGKKFLVTQGFVVSKDGYVITSSIVGRASGDIIASINNKQYKMKLIGSDDNAGISILKIIGRKKFDYVYLNSKIQNVLGKQIVVIGRHINDKSPSVSAGIVSSSRLNIRNAAQGILINNYSMKSDKFLNVSEYIMTDATAHASMSGSLVVDKLGRVLGIYAVIRDSHSLNRGVIIPANAIYKSYLKIKKYGYVPKSEIGVSIKSIDYPEAINYGVKKPKIGERYVLIVGFNNDTAKKAGFQVDDLIYQLGLQKVYESNILSVLQRLPLNKKSPVTVIRNGKKVYLKLKPSTRNPKKSCIEETLQSEDTDVLPGDIMHINGMLVTLSNDKVRKKFPGIPEDFNGIVVIRAVDIIENVIKKGTAIININGINIKSISQLETIFKNARNKKVKHVSALALYAGVQSWVQIPILN